ncbi:putative dehydrodolichyl diphosphate synthetase [Suhomyces tanzawaensis NRRL Y-17324]|uniref:Alkyl transferase n=1 Tax=Suhomyces tanzawaensis NRRL Y-17324 TaxID=984487 RepID=A0A1E4SM18_9ASCO|nr:putative dehydrodolichyl diphosphate synthetase [Suhomyces tanzawaensis NRRL Y-17324]ODV80561.1 putative dehydrodolichyl diphosphate synthetase [Suhomyces tanzawaensis NRRL Y-17324]
MSDWVSTFPGYRNVLTTAKKVFGRIIQTGPTPKHVGMIMDGNRRYAKSKKMEVKEGHNLGFESMANILELLYETGVKSVTVYAFSIENFSRLNYEVKALMDLATLKLEQISQNGDLCEQYGIKVRVLGDTSLLPQSVQDIIKKTTTITERNTRAVLNICFPYTSREEMTHLIKCVVADSVNQGNTFLVDENSINQHLYTGDNPPVDLLLRTSGTYRLSDFLLWQCVSPDCSVVFIDKLWPEFRPWDMCAILLNWSFNKYWYGHGNGNGGSFRNPAQASSPGELVSKTTGASGYKRYTYDEEEDDEETDGTSDLGGDEIDTVTSEEGLVSPK